MRGSLSSAWWPTPSAPLDIIPDFIPILGHLDDLVILPLGIYLAVKMVPAGVFAECRERAREIFTDKKKLSLWGAAVVLLIWLLLVVLVGFWVVTLFQGGGK